MGLSNLPFLKTGRFETSSQVSAFACGRRQLGVATAKHVNQELISQKNVAKFLPNARRNWKQLKARRGK